MVRIIQLGVQGLGRGGRDEGRKGCADQVDGRGAGRWCAPAGRKSG